VEVDLDETFERDDALTVQTPQVNCGKDGRPSR
jgi:hypothetical protein